jgi:N6-L-threonylcarbamoyladenine synthase
VLVLGIETSCDETAAAVVADGQVILSNIVASQMDLHAKYGGVVPEIAARKHVEAIGYVVQQALDASGKTLGDIDAIAVTAKRGLIGSLLVGVAAAKTLAYVLKVPLIGVHHVEGHIFANLLTNPDIPMPHVCLTVSGGHSMLVYVRGRCEYELLGDTLDDAAGEAFDKIAKFLGMGFPGGPVIDRMAAEGNCCAFNFPRPVLRERGLDFSFSGLKTAVINMFKDKVTRGEELPLQDIAASFQEAVVEVLVTKTLQAVADKDVSTISVSGGVSANRRLRAAFSEACQRKRLQVFFPPMALCGDNAAMIAAAGHARLSRGERSGLDLDAIPNIPLDMQNGR